MVQKPANPSFDEIRFAPKIDLHRHLLGSARLETLWELAGHYGAEWARKPLREFRNAVVHGSPARSLQEYIAPWEIFRELIRTPDDIRRIAIEAAQDAVMDGVVYVEFRTGIPGLPITDGISPQTRIPSAHYLEAIQDGFAQVPGIACRLVASITRHAVGLAPLSVRATYADFFFETVAAFRGDLIVGLDLSGLESNYSAESFTDFFRYARSIGLPSTVHAGETEGPEEVWTAIDELGASRIGHGTSAPEDPSLVKELIKRRIALEVCPTAGWLVGRIRDRYRHPIIQCDLPLPYVICTDNPTLNSSTQSQELAIAAEIAGVGLVDFARWQFQSAAEFVFDPKALASVLAIYARRHTSQPIS